MKLDALFEDQERIKFMLKFQQELIDLGWDAEMTALGGNKFKLAVSRNGGEELKLYALRKNDEQYIVRNVIDDRTRSLHTVYFKTGQDFADYAHEHNL